MVTLKAALQIAANTEDGIITGDATDNVDINKTQGLRYKGTSTVWKDMIGDLFGKRLLSTAGKVDYDFANNCIDFASGGSIGTANDRIGANVEINHEMMVGSSIVFYPHIHWFQEVVTHTPRNSYGINLTTPAWNTLTMTNGSDSIFDTTNLSGEEYMGQITRSNAPITVDCGLSDTFQFQVARTDSLGGTMKVFFLDEHGAVDSDGSDEEITKT